MSVTHRVLRYAAVSFVPVLSLTAGCKDKAVSVDLKGTSRDAPPTITNRIDVPEAVRRNLGITFAKVERRQVVGTIRVPGQFELLPSARREYRTVLPARVELLVKQYDRVEPGQMLARLDSPEWRRVQHEAVEAEGEIKTAEARVDVAEATAAENERAVALLRQRTNALAEANASRADLTAELALAESKSARLAAEVRASKVAVSEAHEHYASRLRVLAAVVNLPKEDLLRPSSAPMTRPAAVPGSGGNLGSSNSTVDAVGEPLWRTINLIEVRASAAGVVESTSVTNGGWIETAGLVLTVTDPSQLRFRASALQSDLGALKDGATVAIVPPRAIRASANDSVPAELAIGLEATAGNRTVDVLLSPKRPVPWAKPGVSAFAEISIDRAAEPDLAIPVAAVVQDELVKIYFRRDPTNPDKVIRVAGDFGASDGRWVSVLSGLKAGDEVVVDGIYELKLTGSGKTGGADGHFHADGTWHPNGTPEK
ncbi:efflux RND transporter periplasmic adaptor subunit [Humisphaera borealis]|uniref:HlyD family efflux transporter periplasmic adaptor subunit n=1 Tax=Humisphaera borealis TaxID=2807512 RepID=A0A7M2WZS1_9BACT|nr:HlyD family efflux transporter periplasmic adaptor subunit [Humisphaera borealis]QOV90692.1 HlyD family efflux transporter periplasmic adaptor subunit [Humisphaera borealis]